MPLVDTHESVGSTNDRAAELARDGAPAWTVVVANEQTAGRGRRGDSWFSPPGSGLWMSVLLGDRRALPQLPLLVGLACAEAIEKHLDGVRIGLKWPNDLFLAGRKVGGVLCERAEETVVAGIGINLRTPGGGFEAALSMIAISLEAESGKTLLRSALAGTILRSLREILVGEGAFASALPRLEARDVLSGRGVMAERCGPGIARGIDASGALVVERPDTTRVRVISGSVRLLDVH